MTDSPDSGGRWQTLRRELGRRLAQRLFDDLARAPDAVASRPANALGARLAFAIAAAVYAAGAAFGIAGVAILLAPWQNLFIVLLGITLVLLCALARPRFGALPDRPLARADYPMLHHLAERVAQAIGARPPHAIEIGAEFNASYRTAGWRGRRCVMLGAPLLAVLDAEERVAVLAHELSHGANGDPLRGRFLFGAVQTLETWTDTLRPEAIGQNGRGLMGGPIIGLLLIPLDLLQALLAWMLMRGVQAIYVLVLRSSQHAEYLADRLAARVAGRAPMQRMLHKLEHGDTALRALRRHLLTQPETSFAAPLRHAVDALSDDERTQRQAESRARLWQVDATHPPTALRIDMLALGPAHAAQPLLTPAEQQALDAEFESLIDSQRRELANRVQDGWYEA